LLSVNSFVFFYVGGPIIYGMQFPISNNDITVSEYRIQTFVFDVVYVSETGRIVNILLGRTFTRYDQLTDLTYINFFFSWGYIF
jgi:hypothetical protein